MAAPPTPSRIHLAFALGLAVDTVAMARWSRVDSFCVVGGLSFLFDDVVPVF